MVAKRKSDVAESSENKRARIDTSKAEALVHSILANPLEYPIPEDDDEIRQSFIDLAKYASYLREMASPAQQAISSAVSAAKSSEQLAEAAEKVAKAARSGIKKQMTWKPSCKTGSAKFNYDGLCQDPAVFGHLLGLGGPPSFKMKKFPKAEFEDLLGDLRASARYSSLSITSDVNVRYNAETGEFKFTGNYGA